jgi:hypothetical protein
MIHDLHGKSVQGEVLNFIIALDAIRLHKISTVGVISCTSASVSPRGRTSVAFTVATNAFRGSPI